MFLTSLRGLRLLHIILVLSLSYTSCSSNNIPWEELLDDNEKLALEAIKCLHRQLDDDKDGNINLDESNEYLREELKYERDYEKRQRAFHQNNDNQVTVRELWDTWVKSEVHNWTVEQTIEWLTVFVALPQYASVFADKGINGSYLPRLAVNHQQFLSSGLGVKDMIHKQKVSLKAQDVVLFGPPKEYTNYVKDVVLTSLLAIAMGICWNVFVRYKSSQRELSKIIKDMEGLAKAEKELQDLQNVIEKNKMEREEQMEKSLSQKCLSEFELPDDQMREEVSRLRSEVEASASSPELSQVAGRTVESSTNYNSDKMSPSCCEELEDQILVLRSELQRAEVELQDKCWVPPPALQHWLQLTYELELKSYNRKKHSAERQLRQAKDACDKLKKKRSSVLGAFVSTHGKSIDDVDKAILEAKGSLTEITQELQERMHRWKQIEILGNCSIMNNPGLHYLETVLRGYGKSHSGPGSVISNSQDEIDDDAASSIYCSSAVHKLVSTSTYLMFPGGNQPNAVSVPSFASSSIPPIASCSRRSSNQQPFGISNGVAGGGVMASNGSSNAFVRSTSPNFLETTTSPTGSIKNRELSVSSSASSTTSSTVLTAQLQGRKNSSIPEFGSCGDQTSSSPIELEGSVSGPVSSGNFQQSIPRSSSTGNMQKLRSVTRDTSSSVEEENMPADACEMAARDRRVTFGIRSESRLAGEKILTRENGLDRREMMLSSISSSTAPPQTTNVSEGDFAADSNSETFNSKTEQPDLLKLSSYPPTEKLKEQEKEDIAIAAIVDLSQNPVESQSVKSTLNGTHTLSTSDPREATRRKYSYEGKHHAKESLADRKVRFSDKAKVLRSISRFVSHSSENISRKSHKHYKVHASESKLNGPILLPAVYEIREKDEMSGGASGRGSESTDQSTTLPRTKSIKSKLFSSFRGKKKLGSIDDPTQNDGKVLEINELK